MIPKPSLHCFEPKIIFQPSEEGFSNKSDFEMRRLRKFLQIIKNCIFEKCHHFSLKIEINNLVQFNILILHFKSTRYAISFHSLLTTLHWPYTIERFANTYFGTPESDESFQLIRQVSFKLMIPFRPLSGLSPPASI